MNATQEQAHPPLALSNETSPYLQAQERSDCIPQEGCIRLQGINEEVGVFCGFVKVLVFPEIEVLQAWQGHYTWSARHSSARLSLSVLCVEEPASPTVVDTDCICILVAHE